MILCSSPFLQYQTHREEILKAILKVMESGNYVLGPEVENFENNFSKYCGVNHSIGVGSGTDALILAMKALNIGPGDEVITVSYTALATVAAIVAIGATPVLVDVDSTYMTMDPVCLKSALTTKTKAIIPVHLYGQLVDFQAIKLIADENGIPIIEDCAQSTGARYFDKRAGSLGVMACFSFYPTKNLGGIGDGGMVTTSNSELANKIKELRQYGWNEQRMTNFPGINSRLDEVQAAILNIKLKSLDQDNLNRANIAKKYFDRLSNTPVKLTQVRPNTQHVFHLFTLTSSKRDWLRAKLLEGGVMAGVHYPMAAHQHDGYAQKCILPKDGLKNTELLPGKILSLPMYPELTEAQVVEVVEVVRKAFADSDGA
jgi:dTDP-4-amino-4,6-dideoxygalactose transaminase